MESSGENKPIESTDRRRAVGRLVVVIAGIVVGQAILYGPSLIGSKILLPLDTLAEPGMYLPRAPASHQPVAHNNVRSDLILAFEPLRRFTAEEMAAGRWAMWTPYQFAGAPFIFAKYSPFWILESVSPSPLLIAWVQLLVSLTAGIGMYLFCRRVLDVTFWPAALAAWCYPISGFLIFWQGYPLAWAVVWLPWLLLAIDGAVRRPSGWSGLGVAAATCLAIIGGQLDVGGQVLLVSGLYAVGRLLDAVRRQYVAERPTTSKAAHRAARARRINQWRVWRRPVAAGATVAAGWTLGIMLAAPYLLPLLEYSQTGSRMMRRAKGAEERPPVGLAALPQAVLPDMCGTTQRGNAAFFPQGEGNQLESSAAAYAGLLAMLFAAPLAWCSRLHRSIVALLTALALLGLCWCVNVPIVVDLLRIPGLNMLSHNRLVFMTAFSVVALMAIGLDVIWQGGVPWRWWLWIPAACLDGLFLWCLYRTMFLPEPLATYLPRMVSEGRPFGWITSLADVATARASFVRSYAAAAILCGLGLASWAIVYSRPKLPRWFFPALACVLLADLGWFAWDRSAQCDPSLYYPRIAALEDVRQSAPGRIIGYRCLPPALSHVCGLRDVRGYDAVDPSRLVDLLELATDPRPPKPAYAVTQWLAPKVLLSTSGAMRISPVLDMLNVRYLIFRGTPPVGVHPDFSSPDYWVLVNQRALSRVFVPDRVQSVPDSRERLAKLGDENFDARRVAYVEQPVSLPIQCRGSAEIAQEIPTRIRISVDMQTAGLVVLSDRWDQGWAAYLNGKRVPILRTDHALRGVVAPAGKGVLEFRYEPASLTWGIAICTLALLGLAAWAAMLVWTARRGLKSPDAVR